MKKTSSIVTLLILSIGFSSATYISGDIYIYPNGEVRYNLESDVRLEVENLAYENNKITGTSLEFLSYSSGIWTFTLDLQNYDNVLVDVHLPKDLQSLASIASNNLIDIDDKTITIIEPQNFGVSYKLKNSQDFSWLFWPILLIIIVIAYLIYKKSIKRKEHLNHILPLVNEFEEKILNTLMKSPKRQKELRKILNIPKASFSRYIFNLEKKKLVIREGEGRNKIVKLK